jgi:hypothetical protein
MLRSAIAAALLGLLMSASQPGWSQETMTSWRLDSLVQRARRDSNDATAHYQVAMGYWDRKKWDEAEKALRQALVVAPSYREAHLPLGHYRRAFLLNPMVDLRLLGKFEEMSVEVALVRGRLVFFPAPWWTHELTKSALSAGSRRGGSSRFGLGSRSLQPLPRYRPKLFTEQRKEAGERQSAHSGKGAQ